MRMAFSRRGRQGRAAISPPGRHSYFFAAQATALAMILRISGWK
jgi:hypothetical protein